MTIPPIQSAASVIEALVHSVGSAGRYNPNDVTKPAAILWADQDAQWLPVIAQLRRILPQLLTLGPYMPEHRTGPAIWLRCLVDGALVEPAIPDDAIPIVYLPGISRQSLRAGQECPDELKPLVELQYRGVCWTQRNGKDWTVEAFLVSEDALGLDVARDAATRRALHSSLVELVLTPLGSLRGRRLEAEDFDRLLIEDTVRDLLVWLNDPADAKSEWAGSKWTAFRSRCKAEYGFDPDTDGELVGAERLGGRQGKWAAVWERFYESPVLYPGLPDRLRSAMPRRLDTMFDPEPWPQRNEEQEAALRKDLAALKQVDAASARATILSLESKHCERRTWVWAKLDWAPLAESLKHLAVLAEHTATNLGGATPDEMAVVYADRGYRADLAVLDALSSVKTAVDIEAVSNAIHNVYLPWLEESANHLQRLSGAGDVLKTTERVSVEVGGIVLFADGLRFDVAVRLVETLRVRGFNVTLGKRWAALPTVTATAKNAVSPVAQELGGDRIAEDFAPYVVSTKQSVNAERLRRLLGERGYQYVPPGEIGNSNHRGWSEYGELDTLGHTLQAKLAARVEEQIALLIERVEALIEGGWTVVRIVTDHGWLLVPGGLPKVDLPKYLTQSRWARCAVIKGHSRVDVPTVPWYWNSHEHVAVAPGAHCFGKGYEYAHGGVSLQECLIPDINVTAAKSRTAPVFTIQQHKWRGLRCDVQLAPEQAGIAVELRTKVNDAGSRVGDAKKSSGKGLVSLLVVDDELVGTPAVIVVRDAAGHVISKQATIIGGDDI